MTVIGRERESKLILSYIEVFKVYGKGNILYISGVPGSGKTYTVKNVIENISDIIIGYVNCSEISSPSLIYKRILNSLKCCRPKVPYLDYFRRHLSTCKNKHLLIIDEIDFMKKNYYNIFEMPFLNDTSLQLILISNTLGLIGSKLESRIGKNRLEFKPYTADVLSKFTKSKAGNYLAKRVAAGTGDFRLFKKVLNENFTQLSQVNIILKNKQKSCFSYFFDNLQENEKLLIYLIKNKQKLITKFYIDYKVFCNIKKIEKINFYDFKLIVNDLIKFGIFKKKNLLISLNYLEEEIELVSNNYYNKYN